MTTVSLRTLIREPRKVKLMTRGGQAVQVTDHGKPLWILQPNGNNTSDEAGRIQEVLDILDEVRAEKPTKPSAAQLLEESRR